MQDDSSLRALAKQSSNLAMFKAHCWIASPRLRLGVAMTGFLASKMGFAAPEGTHELAALRDIHLPPPVSTWFIAPGWLMLYTLLFAMLIGVAWKRHRIALQNKPIKEALVRLKQIHKVYLQGGPLETACDHINVLLKCVALHYHPRAHVAQLHGQAWIIFLHKTGPGLDFKPVADFLLVYPYQPPRRDQPLPKDAISPLIILTETWIKQQRKSRP